MLYDDDDPLFGGGPKKSFFDITRVANQNLVEQEIENIITRNYVLERFLSEFMEIDEELNKKITTYIYSNMEEIENARNDAYINHMGNIVTQNE